MLRKVLETLIKPEQETSILESKDLINQLTSEQQKLIQEFISKRELLPILELVHTFEHNGDPKEHAQKLSNLFKDVNAALHYLVAYGKKFPGNEHFVHDACLIPLLSDITWKKLTTQQSAKLLLDPDLKRSLFQTKEFETQLEKDKKDSEQITQKLLETYKNENTKELSEFINSTITEINKFCKKYEKDADNRENGDEEKNQRSLVQRNELYAARALLNLNKPFKQWTLENLRDYYARFISLNNDDTKGFFLKHGLGEKNYKTFLELNRENAGKNIPDISIDGAIYGHPGFYLKKLNVTNENEAALAACLGKETDCCQSLSGEAGEPCAIHGLTDPNGGFYVLFKGDPGRHSITDKVCAQSWVWKSKTGVIVFDSIEVPNDLRKERIIHIISQLYRELAFKLVHEKGIPAVNCGTSSGCSSHVGYDYTCASIEKPLDYDSYRDSHKQLPLAHKDFPYDLESKTQQHDDQYIEELKSNQPIQSLKKLSHSINVAFELNRSDLINHLISLTEKYGTDAHIKDLMKKIDYKELLYFYSSEKEKSDSIYRFITTNTCDISLHSNGENLFTIATRYNDVRILRYLVENYPIDEEACYDLINKSVQLGHIESCKLFLNLKLDWNRFDIPQGMMLVRALDMSRFKDHLEPLKDQLEMVSHLIDCSTEEAKSNAFAIASTLYEKISILNLFIKKGVSINSKSTWPGSNGRTILHHAIQYDRYEAVKYLLEYKEQKVELEAVDDEKNTPIFRANHASSYSQNHLDIFSLLLKAGVNINAINNKGQTVLMDLIDYYSNQNFKKAQCNVLGVERMQDDKIKLLLEHKPDLSVVDHNGDTAITLAAKNRQPVILKLILDSKLDFDINAINHQGETALFLAAANGCFIAIESLLEHGADPTKIDIDKLKLYPGAVIYSDVIERLHHASEVWLNKSSLRKLPVQDKTEHRILQYTKVSTSGMFSMPKRNPILPSHPIVTACKIL